MTLLLLTATAGISACGITRSLFVVKPTEKAPHSAPSDRELEVGEIAFVRGTERPFVLIRLARATPLPDHATLETRPVGDRPISTLRLSSEQRGNFRTADILAGRPRLGDAVVMPYPDDAPSNALGTTLPAPSAGKPDHGTHRLAAAEDGMVPDPRETSPLPFETTTNTSPPIQMNDRVVVRTRVSEIPATVDTHPAEPLPAENSDGMDAGLPLSSREALPGEDVPFIERIEPE